jgi:hypothetical protein
MSLNQALRAVPELLPLPPSRFVTNASCLCCGADGDLASSAPTLGLRPDSLDFSACHEGTNWEGDVAALDMLCIGKEAAKKRLRCYEET